jgi:plastocyanin
MKSHLGKGTHFAVSLYIYYVALQLLSVSMGTLVLSSSKNGGSLLGWAREEAVESPTTLNQTFGQIRGIVRIQSRIKSKSMAFNIYSRGSHPLPVSSPVPAVNEVENVIIYLEGSFSSMSSSNRDLVREKEETAETRSPEVDRSNPSIRQVNETFVPHVLPIIVGTTVEFPNGDPFFHNVFSLSGTKSFDLGRYPKGQIRAVRFDKPGIIKVFCHIHSNMSAVILVFKHPYFTVPDSGGQFLLPAVPIGSYTLVCWHERLQAVKRPITVKSGETISVDVVL